MGDYIGNYYRAYEEGYWKFRLRLILGFRVKGMPVYREISNVMGCIGMSGFFSPWPTKHPKVGMLEECWGPK